MHECRILLKRGGFYSHNTKLKLFFDTFTLIYTYKQTFDFLGTCFEHALPKKKNCTDNKNAKRWGKKNLHGQIMVDLISSIFKALSLMKFKGKNFEGDRQAK